MIEYRYPGEDWKVIDGDDFSLDESLDFGNNAFHAYLDATVQTQANRSDYTYQGYGCGDTITIRTRSFSSGKIVNYELNQFIESEQISLDLTTKNSTRTNREIIKFVYPDSNGDHPLYLPNVSYLGSCSINNPSFARVGVKDVRNLRFEPLSPDVTPVECCILTITKDGEIVFQETRDVCPEVREGDKCPEGTCKVDCHTHYCCYGSDGKAVYSFQK